MVGDAKVGNGEISRYVEKLTPSLDNLQLVADHFSRQTPSKVHYLEPTVF